MLKNILVLILVQFIFSSSLLANDKLNIFACEPEWKSLAEEIGGDKVKAISATHAKQDPHHIDNQADVCHAYQIVHAHGVPDDHIIVM